MSVPRSGHLTDLEVGRYRRRSLDPAELLAVDDHIHECEACRRRLARGEPLEAAWEAWEEVGKAEEDSPAAPSRNPHPRPLSRWERGAIDRSTSSPSPLGRGGQGVRALAAALAVIAVLGVWWMMRSATPPERQARESAPPASERTPEPPPAPVMEAEEPILVLTDNGRRVSLDRQGRLAGLGSLDPGLEGQIAAVLRAGRIERPEGQEDLLGAEGVLRGGEEASGTFAPVSPVGTAVATGRPTFLWTSWGEGASYTVMVFDAGFQRVAGSDPIPETRWTPPRPLPPGEVYTWQVTARRGDEEATTPAPPMPEARFRVLDEPRSAEIMRSAREHAGSHLALGVLYARAGLLDDAERELRALAEANPESAVARGLLRSVESWRSR